MARARTIKPGFFSNEHIAELAPLAQLLFIGLWCLADREGRLEDRPKRIKAGLFPYTEVNMDGMLRALATAKFIERYEVAGTGIIQIVNFSKHQSPHPKETPSSLPENVDNPPSRVIKRQDMEKPELATPTPSSSFPSHSLQSLTPTPPENLSTGGDNLGEKKEGVFLGKEGFKIIPLLSDKALENAKKNAPGWDIYRLASIYEKSVKKMGIPRLPDKAFPAWCGKYTKGKRP